MAGGRVSKPVFFASAAEWRDWLERHHETADAIVLGLVKKGSGLAGLSYRDALDDALCYGWIDGVAGSVDDKRWTVRFTPRRPRSIWSAKNRKRVGELMNDGRMAAPGIAAFENRDKSRQESYSFENKDAGLAPEEAKRFRDNAPAWRFFGAMPKSYRKSATWWVVSAKRAETRQRRLAALIEDCAAGRKIKPLRRAAERAAEKRSQEK